jgi:ketosteroid isomerase-like protein
MSDGALDTIARAFAALNRRDLGALLATCHPEIEWRPLRAGVGPYHGHDGIRQALDDVHAEFDELHNEPRRWTDLGDRVLVAGRLVAKERATGLRVDFPGAWIVDVRDGLVVRVEAFASEDAAAEASRARG